MKANANPFDIITEEINAVKSQLNEVKDLLTTAAATKIELQPTFNKIPVQEIFKQRFLSKPTFYQHVKDGTISLYKLGGRSYVDATEFNNAFKRVNVA